MSSSPNISVKPEYTEEELRERAAAFDQRFGNNALEKLNGQAPIDRELIESTNEFLRRASERATQDRAVEQIEFRERQERFAAVAGPGEWVPGAESQERRQQLREDWQRRQDWNETIKGGAVSADTPERSLQDLKAPSQLTNPEIVTEARELHARFSGMMERWEEMPAGRQRDELREEMKPLVLRENELREEYTGRMKAAEISRDLEDRVPEQSIGYGR